MKLRINENNDNVETFNNLPEFYEWYNIMYGGDKNDFGMWLNAMIRQDRVKKVGKYYKVDYSVVNDFNAFGDVK